MYEDNSLLVNSTTLAILVILMVVIWVVLTAPVLYALNGVEVPEKSKEMRSAVAESVLDALELACGLLIVISFKTDMDSKDTVLFVLVFLSYFNIFGYAAYVVYLLRIAASTLDLQPLHIFVGYHCCFTLLVIVPELILETLQYVDTNDLTDLVGVIGLSLDLGFRLKAAGTFVNRGDEAGVSNDLKAVDQPEPTVDPARERELLNEVTELQLLNAQLRARVPAVNFMGCMTPSIEP